MGFLFVDSTRAQDPVVQAFRASERLAFQGHVESAIKVLQDAASQSGMNARQEGDLRVRAAEYLRYLQRFPESLSELKTAETLLGTGPETDSIRCELYGVRGQVYLDTGLPDLAMGWLEREQDLVTELEDRGETAHLARISSNLRSAHLALAREDYVELELLVEEALADDTTYERYPQERAKLMIRLGLGWNEMERVTRPAQSAAEAILKDALAEPKLATVEKTYPELVLAESTMRRGKWIEARSWLDSARGRMDPEMGAAAPKFLMAATFAARCALDTETSEEGLRRALTDLEAGLHAFVARWREVPKRPGGYGFLEFSDTRAALSELHRLRKRLFGKPGEESFLQTLWDVQALGALTPAAEHSSSDFPLGHQLADDQALLIFLPAPERTHLWIVTSDQHCSFDLPQEDLFEEPRAALVRALQSPPTHRNGTSLQAAVKLQQMMFPAAARQVLSRARRWTVSGLDVFPEFPLEALPWDEGTWIGTAFALDHLPSLPFLGSRPPASLNQPTAWLLCHPESDQPPSTGSSLPAQGNHSSDGRELLAAYPRRSQRVLDGPDATLSSLFNAPFGDSDILQIHTHGIQDTSREFSAGFLLSPCPKLPDGMLFADGLASLRLPPLVILTSCRVGSQRRRRGDAYSAGLAGVFLKQGAQAVCLSAFPLEVRSTEELSRVFHQEIAAGRAPAEAMRHARATLSRVPGFEDPFYHSLIRVVGEGQQPLFAKASARSPGPWWLVLIAVAVVAGAVSRKRPKSGFPSRPSDLSLNDSSS